MNIKYFLLIIPFLLCSCKTVIQNLIGNHLIDMHYAPAKQVKQFYSSIPYTLENGLIIIKTKVNNSDKEYNFMFDTGAITMISEELACELKLENGITIVGRDAFNNETVGSSYIVSMQIDNLDIKNLRINSINSDFFISKCNQKIDGIIGPNVLNQGFFYFNSSEKKLIITNIKESVPIESFDNPVHLKRIMGQPYIKVKGFREKWLKLDTGYANGFVLLNKNSKILSKKDTLIKQKYLTFKSLSSEVIKTVNYYNRKVIIGKTSLEVPIEQFNRKSGNGNIGSNIIEYNNIIIDVSNSKLYLQNNSKKIIVNNIPNINFRFKNNKIIIGALTKNGNLEMRGIRMNDTISKINNTSVKEIKNICDFDYFKSTYINNIFPLIIEIEKNNEVDKHIISKEEFYE